MNFYLIPPVSYQAQQKLKKQHNNKKKNSSSSSTSYSCSKDEEINKFGSISSSNNSSRRSLNLSSSSSASIISSSSSSKSNSLKRIPSILKRKKSSPSPPIEINQHDNIDDKYDEDLKSINSTISNNTIKTLNCLFNYESNIQLNEIISNNSKKNLHQKNNIHHQSRLKTKGYKSLNLTNEKQYNDYYYYIDSQYDNLNDQIYQENHPQQQQQQQQQQHDQDQEQEQYDDDNDDDDELVDDLRTLYSDASSIFSTKRKNDQSPSSPISHNSSIVHNKENNNKDNNNVSKNNSDLISLFSDANSIFSRRKK